MACIYKDKRCLIVQNNFVNWKTGEIVSPIETPDFTVVQVAESYFIGGFEIGEHIQPCDLELTVLLTGTLVSCADDNSKRVEKGEVYLSFKGEIHRLCSKGSCRFLTIAVNFKPSSEQLLSAIRDELAQKRAVPCRDNFSLCSRIASELSSQGRSFSDLYINSLLTELLVELARGEDISVSAERRDSDECVFEIANYIDCNFLNICSAEELCRFGYSYQYICRLFKDTYGISPGAYLFSRRMDYAAGCLGVGSSVSEVSHILGYSSPYNFSRAFKKHFGYPPSTKIVG